jgi:exosortase A-associated hydrolase 2
MQETPFFFDRGPWQLFGVYHEPRGARSKLPFVFCHPFGEEKLWAHRVFVSFARELARRGHAVLRFDYGGNGDSGGTFADSSVDSAVADIDAAIVALKARVGCARVGLLGLRLGASLAFRVAARRDDVESLVLWAPVVDGSRYIQELLRINLATQMTVYGEVREDREDLVRRLETGDTVNVDGYEMSRDMSRQLSALSLGADGNRPGAPMLLVQIERAPHAKAARDLEALRSHVAAADLQIVQEEPFWKEIQWFYDRAPNLFRNTLSWLGHEERGAA